MIYIVMAKCSSSTVVVGRPNQQTFNQLSASPNCGLSQTTATINSGCNQSTSPFACCNLQDLSPRPNRDAVREKIRDYVLLKLGAPVIDIELDSQQLELAVDESLAVIEEYAPHEYFSYYAFMTTPGKSVYELPADVGYVRHVYYRETAQPMFQAQDLGGQIPLEYFGLGNMGAGGMGAGGMINPQQPVWGQAGAWTLFSQYSQTFSRLSSALGGWEWVGGYRHIKLYPIPCGCQQAVVHYIQKCKDWTCMTQSMAEGALAFAMIMVGEIRSKYTNIPGPNGGVQLNGADMLQRGLKMKEDWENRLLSRWGDLPQFFMG